MYLHIHINSHNYTYTSFITIYVHGHPLQAEGVGSLPPRMETGRRLIPGIFLAAVISRIFGQLAGIFL